MPEAIATYRIRVRGWWNTRHTLFEGDTELGVLSIERSAKGRIDAGHYRPLKGEVLHFRRDPGLLRSQFSLWTEGREWLGSSLRWSFVRREIALATGNKPYRLVPVAGFRRGWRILAPKTGEVARILPRAFRRSTTIEVYRRTDFELVLFAYFLGCQIYLESAWPARDLQDEKDGLAASPSA